MQLRKTIITLILSVLIVPRLALADPAKDFVMSCTYGVLAGTLVGTATLAFSDKPGDNLNRIARGASIGLYSGILLGLYVLNASGGGADEEPIPANVQMPRLQVYPIVSDRGVEGGAVQYSIVKF